MISVQTSSRLSPKPCFSGQVALLAPYTKGGIIAKGDLTKDDSFFRAVNIPIDNIYSQLVAPEDSKPMLLSGPPGAGKSTLAGFLSNRLEQDGQAVITIDEKSLKSQGKRFFDKEALEKLKQNVNYALKKHDRVFIFLDEPQYIPERECDRDESIQKHPSRGTLNALLQYVQSEPRIKLVGVMHNKGFEDVERHTDSREMRDQLETLFPAENRILLPDPRKLPKDTILDLVNKALLSAGFEMIPSHAVNLLNTVPFSHRDVLRLLQERLNELTSTGTRKEDPHILEMIPDALWERVTQSLHQRGQS